jgi:hypothetical protein
MRRTPKSSGVGCFVGPSSYDPIISSINTREIIMTTRRGAGLDCLGGPANSHRQVLTDVGLDDDDCYYVDWQGAWWPWPAWMHPECVDTHFAAENGTCFKYRADDLVLRALELANAVDGTRFRLMRSCLASSDWVGIR